MSELVKLISAWEAYAGKHAQPSAVEFAMHFLAKESNQQLFGGLMPPDLDNIFAKLIGRLANMQTVYSRMALQDSPGFELEWFYYLNSIYHLKEVKKTQVIQYNFSEQTTGIDILSKLKKLGYITERTDPEDKRAKLVKITKTGEKILFKLYQLLHKPTLLMYSGIDPKDKQVVINILKETESRHQALLAGAKNKSLDDMLTETVGKDKIAQIEAAQKQVIKHFAESKNS